MYMPMNTKKIFMKIDHQHIQCHISNIHHIHGVTVLAQCACNFVANLFSVTGVCTINQGARGDYQTVG